MDLEGKKKKKKQTPAVWDRVLFGLGGSGTGRNVESPCVTEKYFFQRRLFFKGMGYYSWPVKAFQIVMTSWLGSVLQGTNKGGFVPEEPSRALRGFWGVRGGRPNEGEGG